MNRRIAKDERARAIKSVKNGMSCGEVAKKFGISYNTIRSWCLKDGTVEHQNHIKKTDDEIIAAIKKAKVVTQTEISQTLGYQTLNDRLRTMIMNNKIKSTIIPARSSSSKISWPIKNYQNKRLYYITGKDLDEWVIEKLPPHMPLGMRRAVTMKLNSVGIHVSELSYKQKYSTVAIHGNVYKKLKAVAKERKISMCTLTETLIKNGLKSIENIKI